MLALIAETPKIYSLVFEQLLFYHVEKDMRCSRAWDKSSDFQLLMHKLLKQGYVDPRLKSLLHKLRDRHREMIDSDDILKYSTKIRLAETELT